MANKMKAWFIAGLCMSLGGPACADSLYQWVDATGTTRLTAEPPPASATSVSHNWQNQPPPMQEKTPGSTLSASSILQPLPDAYNRQSRRWSGSSSQSSWDYERLRRIQEQAMAEEDAQRNYNNRNYDNYGYSSYGYDDDYYNTRIVRSISIPAGSPYRHYGHGGNWHRPDDDDSPASRGVLVTSSKVASATGKAFQTISRTSKYKK